jgi:hypothetical protein
MELLSEMTDSAIDTINGIVDGTINGVEQFTKQELDPIVKTQIENLEANYDMNLANMSDRRSKQILAAIDKGKSFISSL